MKHRPALLAAAVAAMLIAPAATAVEIEGNVTLASDYSFRGWSQTMRDPALQGGFDIGLESGFYVGTWGSNVNFGADDEGDVASMEWDIYAGWSGEVGDGVGLDFSIIHFEYPGDRDDLNYQELAASVSFNDFTLGINYSPEYLAVDDVAFFYPYLAYSYGFANDVSLDLAVGFNLADSPSGDFFGDEDDYIDYKAELSFSMLATNLGIGIYGTDNDACGDDCDARVVVSLSKSL